MAKDGVEMRAVDTNLLAHRDKEMTLQYEKREAKEILFKRGNVKGQLFIGDARLDMQEIPDNSVHLMITSPPYPMIEMWDGQFRQLDPSIDALWTEMEREPNMESVRKIYDHMHENLNRVWAGTYRKMVEGGIACINVGDAARRLNGIFKLFPNHARVIESCERIGFLSLPFIIWRKPTNKPAYKGKGAFLGSGMLPPNAYVGLDAEFILIFRKGKPRTYEPFDKIRYASKYSMEERNAWFTQIWEGVRGTRQIHASNGRRAGAFPDEIPRRLIKMFSVFGETVLDPFLGTGTTLYTALELGRNAIGYEIDRSFIPIIKMNMEGFS